MRYKEFEMPHAPFVHPIFELVELDLTHVSLVFMKTWESWRICPRQLWSKHTIDRS
jgi:hypothetical protein